MPVRLSKVARDLNVGLQTIVDFLTKQSKSVENSPNFKISWEDYLLLAKEFNKEVYEKLLREREIRKAQKKEEELAQKNKKDLNKDRKKGEELVGEKVQLVSDIKVLGTIDLNSPSPKIKKENPVTLQEKNQEQKVEPKQEEKVPEKETQEVVASSTESDVPKQEQVEKNIPQKESSPENSKTSQKEKKVEKSGAQIQKNTPKKDGKKKDNTSTKPSPKAEDVKSFEEALPKLKGEEEIFTLNTPKIGQNINVIGKIDLDKLNQSSRPKPKTKEEKRKERIQREKERKASSQGAKNSKSPENKPSSTTEGNDGKKKRNRFQKGKVDINNPSANKPAPEEKKEKKGEKIDKRSRNDKNRDQREERENKGGKNRDKFDQKKGKKNSLRPEINEEDIQKQVKETLNRLTNKPTKQKGVKYRKEKREAFAQHQQEQMEVASNESKVLKITEFVTVNDLAMMMNVPVNKVIGTCMSVGLMVSINMRLDAEAINLVAEEFGFRTEYVSADVSNTIEEEEEGDEGENLVPRSPIVTIMGHVDHGKTSLLDHIRNTNVIAGEAGGITQHIGAYSVTLQNGKSITFLDTPGHEAFTAMRARGAKITDIAVIIVAADDDVMPQTIEAINHASAANVPMVFAINKIDKPAANPDKIKEALAKMNYLIEEWGGKYQSQDISAKKGLGVRELLDKILLEAEILDLKANPNKKAVGSILESSLDKGRGYVATVLVQTGTLKVGDYILAGTHYGRVKAMFNERNQRLQSAGPSEPVQILGLNGAPQAGDKLNVMETEQEVRSIATKREQLQREQGLRTQKHLTLEDLGRRIAIGNFQELNLIVKGDVDGSVEAIADSFIKLSTKEIQVNVIHKAVGQISESDVILAAASNAIIIGFQVRPSASARKLAEQEEVDIRLYSIIYKAIEEVQAAMEGMLAPEVKEEITATVEIKETFKISKVGTIAGCIVKEGKIKRTSKVRCIRDGIVVYTGELGSLKRFKDDAKEVTVGLECGLSIANFNDIKVGDVIEAYEEIEVKKTLQ